MVSAAVPGWRRRACAPPPGVPGELTVHRRAGHAVRLATLLHVLAILVLDPEALGSETTRIDTVFHNFCTGCQRVEHAAGRKSGALRACSACHNEHAAKGFHGF